MLLAILHIDDSNNKLGRGLIDRLQAILHVYVSNNKLGRGLIGYMLYFISTTTIIN